MRADLAVIALAAPVVSRDAPLPPEFLKTPRAKRSRHRVVVFGVSFVLVMLAGGCDMDPPHNPPTVIGDGIPDQFLDLDTNPTTTLGVYDYFTDPDPDDPMRFTVAHTDQRHVASVDVSPDRSMITITARAPGMAEVDVELRNYRYVVDDRFTITVTAPVCAGKSAETREFRYEANEELDFTEYERDALRQLHAEGWNGNGVNIVIADYFNEDGSPSHGTGVASIVRRYAPNANVHYTATDHFEIPPDVDQGAFHLVNRSFAVSPSPEAEDRLVKPQSKARRDYTTDRFYGAMEVWGAGNVAAPLPGGDPRRAVPALKVNGVVQLLASDGVLHAKSAVLVVGAVNYRPGVSTDDGWVLSHIVDGAAHSPRAGAARHAFIVAPDDNRSHNFAGTSFAAPRVTGASAILSQKCPYLTSEQIGYLLLRSARDLGAPGVDDVYGYGLMDVENAIARAVELMAGYDDFDSTVPPTAD